MFGRNQLVISFQWLCNWSLTVNENLKMQVIANVQNTLKVIGLCTVPNKYFRLLQRVMCAIILLLLSAMYTASLTYAFDHLQMGDIENTLYACFQAAAAICDTGCIFTMSFQKNNVRKIIDELQKLYDECKFASVKSITWKFQFLS